MPAAEDANVLYNKGKVHEAEEDWSKAVHCYRRAAAHGLADAQLSLGLCFSGGKGVPQDYCKAIVHIRLAAAQGNAKAQLGMGIYLSHGQGGVAPDIVEAVGYFRRSAEQGNIDAQLALGVCYADGDGVEQNWAQAVHYIGQAAARGQPEAQFELGRCFTLGTGVPQSWAEAARLFGQAAAQGYDGASNCLVNAQYHIGYESALGTGGVVQNWPKAVRYFTMAADGGDVHAQFRLGNCFRNGEGVATSSVEAMRYFTLAAAQDHMIAQYYLGQYLEHAQDMVGALRYYTLSAAARAAAADGFAQAHLGIGRCLERGGGGVVKDLSEAVRRYRLALAAPDGHLPAELVEEATAAIRRLAADRELASACCLGCGARRKLKTCARCKAARFCGSACVARAWSAHKPHCACWQ